MRLPSLTEVVNIARSAWSRFPLTIVSGVGAAIASTERIANRDASDTVTRLLMTALLGIPLFMALPMLAKSRVLSSSRFSDRQRVLVLSLVGLGTLAGYFFWTRTEPGEARYVHFAQLLAMAHLAVAFGPFVGRGWQAKKNAFWQFNQRLFLRFHLATLYAGVLIGGFSLALLGMHQLLGLDVDDRTYLHLLVWVALVVHPWIVLGGLPGEPVALEQDRSYPSGLKVFCQFALLPLVLSYFLILYVYGGRILFEQKWPSGWVGWLVSGAAVFGMLTLLLLHADRPEPEHGWIRRLRTGYYLATIPLIALLMVAVYQRFEQYRWTERRYLLVVFGVWLLAMAAYMAFSRARNSQMIPLSLCGVIALTTVGPLSACRVALESQSQRLQTLLVKNGLLRAGKLHAAAREPPQQQIATISGIVKYLVETHGAASLNRWSKQAYPRGDLASRAQTMTATRSFMREMGLSWMPEPSKYRTSSSFYAGLEALDISGYDQLVKLNFWEGQSSSRRSKAESDVDAYLEQPGSRLKIQYDGRSYEAALEPLLIRLEKTGPIDGVKVSRVDLSAEARCSDPELRAKISLDSLSVSWNDQGNPEVRSGQGLLLIGRAEAHP